MSKQSKTFLILCGILICLSPFLLLPVAGFLFFMFVPSFEPSPADIKKEDIATIREAFHIPDTIEPSFYRARPETPGWFGREGLEIEMTFKFSPALYTTYLQAVQRKKSWHPMPLSRDFVIKMAGIKQGVISGQYLYWEQHRKPIPGETGYTLPPVKDLPPPGTPGIPTEDELYRKWMKEFKPNQFKGLYKCLASADSKRGGLMHLPKINCSEKTDTMNDFMLGILDTEHQKLNVFVRAKY